MKRRLSNWLKSFTEYSSSGEAPPRMYFWVGVSTIAGALRRRVWIDQKFFKWIPNFYIILVAPPGIVSKSTTASIGMNLLREVPGIHFGPDVVTWPALAQGLANSQEMFTVNGSDVMHPMSALTIESSEFGTFLNPQDREMVDMLVSLWDGKEGVFKKATKTQGDDSIPNPFINIIACTTPAWIEGNFPEYMIGGGFTSRCIFIYAEEKERYNAYPFLAVPKNFDALKADLIHDLELISQLAGEFKLTPDALAWGIAWYEAHYKNRPAHLDNDRFGGYLARKQTHIHKLAMVISAAQRDDLIIDAETLSAANDIVTALEEEMTKVFERIGQNDETRAASELLSLLYRIAPCEVNAAYSLLFRRMSFDVFKSAMQSGLEAGYLKLEVENGKHILRIKHG